MNADDELAAYQRISAVERDTGLTKDTLRMWERRYGFPAPKRDDQGERLYSPVQVTKLRLMRRLLDQGMRPAKLVKASIETLETHLNELCETHQTPERVTAIDEQDFLQLVRLHRSSELRNTLQQTLLKQGLQRFVMDTIGPLNVAVGQAWLRGDIDVPEEHLYSEQLQNVLRNAIGNQANPEGRPRLLLTTLPREQHGLGLLMVEAMLTPEGAYCVSLGIQTPLTDICRVARENDFDIVALSFSLAFPLKQATEQLMQLREQLPPATELWAGGAAFNTGKVPSMPKGVLITPKLEQTLEALHAWRESHRDSPRIRNRM